MPKYQRPILFVLLILTGFHFVIAQKSVTIQSISSDWKMKDASQTQWYNAKVPGCVHSDLLNNKLIPDPYYRTNEKELQWIDKKDWEYKTTLKVSDELFKSDNLELVFKGLDTYANVYLNNKLILSSDNMFREWVVDVKSMIQRGDNQLKIYFPSPIRKGKELLSKNGFSLIAINDQAVEGGLKPEEVFSPFIRKAPYHFGWDWGPRFVTSGIWQPVFLRAWNGFKIEDFYVKQQSLTDQLAELVGQVEINSDKNQTAIVEFICNEKSLVKRKVELKYGANTVNLPFQIEKPKRWWSNGLGDPCLYKVTSKVSVNKFIDQQSHEIGLRTLKLIQKPDNFGHSFYFELNGVPVFAKGENHIPNDMFLNRCTKEVYEWEINTALKSNLNMLRVWGGGIYEDDYFYKLCDRNGIMVWQDFMFACSLYPGNNEFLTSITQEADYQVKRLRNHPSIALWCGNNEIDVAWQNFNPDGGWGWKKGYTDVQKVKIWSAYDTIFNHILPGVVNSLSFPTSYLQSSPSSVVPKTHATRKNPSGDVHYWGVWWGKEPFESYADNIGRFMSEYGFQSFPELETVKKFTLPEDYDIESPVMKNHQKSSIGNITIKEYMDRYYRKPKDFEHFLYLGQLLQSYGVNFAIESHRRAMSFNMGSLVWQINDCWPVASWSSCDYYHRWKALQFQIKRSFEPIILSAYSKGENTYITIVSDKLKDIPAQLSIDVCDFSGKLQQSRSIPILIKANSVTSAFSEATNQLTNKKEDNVLIMTLKINNHIISQKNYYFTEPKNLILPRPKIVSKFDRIGKSWKITLKTDVLAKDVYLNFDGIEGFFSDNYFDLLPGKTKQLTFTPKNNLTELPKLSFMSLIDSY